MPSREGIAQPTVTGRRVGALIVALALTLSLMAWLDMPHAPTEATRFIVETGLLRTPSQLGILMLAVVALVAQRFVISRLAGIPCPRWAPRSTSPESQRHRWAATSCAISRATCSVQR